MKSQVTKAFAGNHFKTEGQSLERKCSQVEELDSRACFAIY